MNSRKEKAEHFLTLIGAAKIEEAFKLHISKDFKHHNPYFRPDAQSLLEAMREDANANPKALKILRSLEDEELVIVHSFVKLNPDGNRLVLVHFFKFKEDQIVEPWDLVQEIPNNIINELGIF